MSGDLKVVEPQRQGRTSDGSGGLSGSEREGHGGDYERLICWPLGQCVSLLLELEGIGASPGILGPVVWIGRHWGEECHQPFDIGEPKAWPLSE
jgi:hypothetical protein